MPIALANGNEVTLDAQITLKQAIEQGSKVAIEVIQEIPWVGDIPIPCTEVVNYLLFHIFITIKNIYLFHFRSNLVCTLDLASTILVMIFCHFWKALVNAVNSFQKVKLVHFHWIQVNISKEMLLLSLSLISRSHLFLSLNGIFIQNSQYSEQMELQ